MSLPEPGSPADRLRHARSDLLLAASAPPSGVLLEALCFHAQQAAGKAVKGVLIHFGVEPPYIHDIRRLLDDLGAFVAVPPEVDAAAILTDYAVLTRYPADLGEIESAEWQEAVARARAAVVWAASVIAGEPTR